ncbi:MAG: CBS domain-containing protein [Pseudomonadota bacterium]|nr:CBS domain-containing protein [Pseudomonadota bacterium]
MKVAEIMSSDVQVITPEQPIQQAARLMVDADTGVVPVGDGERLIGMVTDRDIAVRAVAEGRGPDTPVSEVMSGNPLFAWDDQDVEDVAIQMSDAQVRRMPVLSRDGERLVGIISIGDISRTDSDAAETALSGVSEPGGEHNQSQGG